MTTDPRALLGAYLRQRRELGEEELILDRLTPAQLRRWIAGPEAPPPPAPPPTERRRAPAAPPPRREVLPALETAAIAALPTLPALRDAALGCPRCGLVGSRRSVVFGEGPHDAEVMVVGEAPGEDEDASGRPFVGRAGKLLDRLLLTAGFEREAVFVCNVLKCRPPKNRNPLPEEVEACSPFLVRQVELVKPRLILAFGAFAAQTLLGTEDGIGRLRRREHRYHGVPVIPTYHPAACLRTSSWIRSVWEDLQRARAVLDAT